MSLMNVFNVSASALTAQSVRLNTVSSNIANADTVAENPADTYRAKQPLFKAMFENRFGAEHGSSVSTGVQVTDIHESIKDFKMRYEPDHPFADESGYVAYPNVEVVEEMADMISASRAYQTNVEVMKQTKQMLQQTLQLGR